MCAALLLQLDRKEFYAMLGHALRLFFLRLVSLGFVFWRDTLGLPWGSDACMVIIFLGLSGVCLASTVMCAAETLGPGPLCS